MQYYVLMVVRVMVMATIVALLVVVTPSFLAPRRERTVLSRQMPAIAVDGQAIHKVLAATPRRVDDDQLPTKRIGPKRATLLGLMMMLGGQLGGR